MKTYINKLAFLFLFLFILVSVANAQTSNSLPLQPEKLNYAREVEQEAISKKDALLMAEAYYLYGKVHVAAQDYLKAKSYFMKSLRIVEKQRKFDKVGRIYLWLSKLEIEQANGAKALEYGHLSLAYARNGSKRQIISAYQIIGNSYVVICRDSLAKNHKHPLQDSLFYYCNLSERMAYEMKDTLSIGAVSNTLGELYRYQRNVKAFQYYKTALELYKAIGHTHNQAVIVQELALTYLRFNQPDNAFPLLKEAERKYKALNIRELHTEKSFAEACLQYYQQKKDWQKAFEQSQLVRTYEHGQMIADRDGAVSRLSVEYDTEKKEAQLKSQHRELALNKENQQTQQRFLVVLSSLLLGTIIASGAFYRLSQKNRRLSLHNAALVQEQNHRVKNNLQLVSSLLSLQSNRLSDESARNAVEDSQRRIEVMSLLQRKLYDDENLAAVNLADFIRELIKMGLQTFEMDQVEVTYQIPHALTLPADYIMRIGLIVNELITNACKYAFPDHSHPALKIEASLDKTTFSLQVADNGKGFDESSLPSKSFGMRLIQMQVEQLYGTYRIENKGGMTFNMVFNLLPSSTKWKRV
jgi:two-component sensor histidine kinase